MIFDSLEEGIVLIQDESVAFMNNVFRDLLQKSKFENEQFKWENQQVGDIKIFRAISDELEALSLNQIINILDTQRNQIYRWLD